MHKNHCHVPVISAIYRQTFRTLVMCQLQSEVNSFVSSQNKLNLGQQNVTKLNLQQFLTRPALKCMSSMNNHHSIVQNIVNILIITFERASFALPSIACTSLRLPWATAACSASIFCMYLPWK